uniref:Uncharacterized protein n=1 Tax=Anguilla anguilla TaxID=7936 RepID=A0A0E9P724_ANGAN
MCMSETESECVRTARHFTEHLFYMYLKQTIKMPSVSSPF